MDKKLLKFIIAISVQLLVILGIIIFKFSILSGGTEVILKIAPVDPRDPFRGDYVTFQYEISNVSYYGRGNAIRNGDTVYVTLRPAGKYWVSTNVSKTKPASENSVIIKGKVIRGGEASSNSSSYTRELIISYGIEEYFVPEGAGRNFSFWGKDIYAKLKIDENGNSVITQLYVNEKAWP